jgi:hypothetical protein
MNLPMIPVYAHMYCLQSVSWRSNMVYSGFVLVEDSIIFYPSSRMRMCDLTYGWVSGEWASRLKGWVVLNIYCCTNNVVKMEV